VLLEAAVVTGEELAKPVRIGSLICAELHRSASLRFAATVRLLRHRLQRRPTILAHLDHGVAFPVDVTWVRARIEHVAMPIATATTSAVSNRKSYP